MKCSTDPHMDGYKNRWTLETPTTGRSIVGFALPFFDSQQPTFPMLELPPPPCAVPAGIVKRRWTLIWPAVFVVIIIGKRIRFLKVGDAIPMEVFHAVKVWGKIWFFILCFSNIPGNLWDLPICWVSILAALAYLFLQFWRLPCWVGFLPHNFYFPQFLFFFY